MEKRIKFNSIQAMRGGAALFVVLYHFRYFLNDTYSIYNIGDVLFSHGYFGVDLFFVLSGFIITYATQDQKNDSGKAYIIKRALRIYPAFLVSLALLCIARGMDLSTLKLTGGYTTENLIKSLLFIPLNLNSPPPHIGQNLLPVAWTLMYEIAFYFIFLVAMSINHKLRSVTASLIIVIGCGLTYFVMNGFWAASVLRSPAHVLIGIFTNPIMLTFIFGVLSYYIFLMLQFLDPIKVVTAGYLIFFISIVMLFSGKFNGHGVLNYGLVSFLFFFSLLIVIDIGKIKAPSWILYLGDISYSLYLMHMVVLLSLEKYTSKFPLIGQTTGVLKFSLAIALSIILASVLFHAVERPCVKIARALIKNTGRRQRPAPLE